MIHRFSGGVFSETLEDGRAGAQIELTPSAIHARDPDGELFSIRYSECLVELGGYNGKMVFCRTPDRKLTIFCDDRKFAAELSLASSGQLDDQLGQSKQKKKRESRRDRSILSAVLIGGLLLLIGSYFAVTSGARAAVKAMPVSVDRQLGQSAFGTMDLGGPVVNDPVLVGAMQSIVDRLSPHAAVEGFDFKVHVIDSPVVNAFALPGGNIVVYTGLIENSASANQVAAVLGHEMSHVTLRHGLQRISHSMGIWVAASLLLGDVSGLMAMGAELFQVATVNHYSRDQENEADAEGVRMLHAAQIDPKGMAQFFQILKDEHGDLPGMLSWISTHPDHETRIERVESLIRVLPETTYQPLKIDWKEVQSHVKDN